MNRLEKPGKCGKKRYSLAVKSWCSGLEVEKTDDSRAGEPGFDSDVI